MADGAPPSPEAVFVGAAIARAVGALVARSTLDDIDPGAVTLVGLAAAAIVLVAVAIIRRSSRDADAVDSGAGARSPRFAVVALGVAIGATAVCTALALDRLPAREASALLFVGPILLAASRVRGALHAAAVALAAIGVVLVAGLHNGDGRATSLLLGGSVAWALLIVAGHRVAIETRSASGLAGALVIAALFATPFGVGHIDDVVDQPRVLVIACVVGVLVAAIALSLELHVLGRVPADRFGLLVVLVPVVTGFFAYVALDETPTAPDIAGAVVIVAAVVIDGVRRSPKWAD